MTLAKGDKIKVKTANILDVAEVDGTVLDVHDWGYIVHIDGDPPEWFGPVDFDGNVLVPSAR